MRPIDVFRSRGAVGGGGGGSSYAAIVAAASPLLWWELLENSGTTVADSSGNGYTGTYTGTGDLSTSGRSLSAVSGFAGIGAGIRPNLISAGTSNRILSADNAALAIGQNSAGGFTVVVWMTGSSGGSQYVFYRKGGNYGGIIYAFSGENVEFYAGAFSGSDPRTGSSIPLAAADTTTPHMIVYRYDNGTWSGWKDGTSIFSVSRTFALNNTTGGPGWSLGAFSSGSAGSPSGFFDAQLYDRALTDTEIADMWAARDSV